MELERIERTVMTSVRWLTFSAVVGSIAGSVLMFYLGLVNTVRAFTIQFVEGTGRLPAEDETVIHLISALDRFLIAIVLLFFSYGVYVLFIRPESPGDLGLPRWLHVAGIGQLKQTLAEVILIVLFVLFLRVALETFVAEGPETTWLQMAKIMMLPVSILMLAAALKLAELHPKGERRPPRGGESEGG